MKLIGLMIVCASFAFSAKLAHAATNIALPFYEPFAYSTGTLGSSVATGSDVWGNSQAGVAVVGGGSLFNAGLVNPVGDRVSVSGGSANQFNDPRPELASLVSSGVLYFSFLLRVNNASGIGTLSTNGNAVLGLTASSGSSRYASVNLVNDSSSIRLGAVKWNGSTTISSSSYFTSPVSAIGSTTYFVVAKYQFVSGTGNDVVTVWLNPSSASFGGSEDAANKVSVSAGTDGTGSLSRLYILRGQNVDVDEIRIGTTWASVTPPGCVSVTAFNMTGGGSYNPGDAGVAVGLSGSQTNVQYRLRVNGVNLGAPVSGTGAALSFGLQTELGTYTVLGSNTLTACTALMSGSAAVTLNAVPIPAFPGAEGFGKYALGGRGGDVYVVTNLNDSGPGSFRNGLANVTGPRTIVFDVSGIINFTNALSVAGLTNITVAGQTAPGKGITLKSNDKGLAVNWCRDFVWRFIKFRSGPDLTGTGGNDCLTTEDGPAGTNQFVNNWILDHCSLSWGVDGNMDLRSIMNYTVQWCLFYEALNDSTHYKLEPHGMCTSQRGLMGNGANHHNLYGSSRDRHPSFGGDNTSPDSILDYRNCVVFNWGLEKNNHLSNTNIGGDADGFTRLFGCNYNVISNYYRRGPELGSSVPLSPRQDTNGSVQMVYFGGNKFTGYPTENDSWAAARNSDFRNALHYGYYDGGAVDFTNNHLLTQPLEIGEFTPQTHTADQAYELILLKGGASKQRDNADMAFLNRVRNKTGFVPDTIAQTAAGAWDTASETRPVGWDTDRDGIPNYWEEAVGMNPNVANNNLFNADGYTDLEHYLNWLAEPHAVGGKNLPVDVSMRTLYGDTNSLAFAVATPTNGAVAMLPGGNVARFTPAPNHTGLASFRFYATNAATGVSFGPLNVGLVFTNFTALPPTNPPPTLSYTGFTNGKFTMLIGGSTGLNYTVQTSTNLVTWSDLWTTNPAALPFLWTDTASTNHPQRFYRVWLAP